MCPMVYRGVWDYLLIDLITCTLPHPRLIYLYRYSLLKYTGIRLYSEVINVK